MSHVSGSRLIFSTDAYCAVDFFSPGHGIHPKGRKSKRDGFPTLDLEVLVTLNAGSHRVVTTADRLRRYDTCLCRVVRSGLARSKVKLGFFIRFFFFQPSIRFSVITACVYGIAELFNCTSIRVSSSDFNGFEKSLDGRFSPRFKYNNWTTDRSSRDHSWIADWIFLAVDSKQSLQVFSKMFELYYVERQKTRLISSYHTELFMITMTVINRYRYWRRKWKTCTRSNTF